MSINQKTEVERVTVPLNEGQLRPMLGCCTIQISNSVSKCVREFVLSVNTKLYAGGVDLK